VTTATLNGVAYPAVTNIGKRPTFETAEETVIETHVLDFDKDLYGARMNLGFVQRLRDEKRFDNIEALKTQIEMDRGQARSLFARMGL
jgi:riboflavin kinase/FMN adenylyltransferase